MFDENEAPGPSRNFCISLKGDWLVIGENEAPGPSRNFYISLKGDWLVFGENEAPGQVEISVLA